MQICTEPSPKLASAARVPPMMMLVPMHRTVPAGFLNAREPVRVHSDV